MTVHKTIAITAIVIFRTSCQFYKRYNRNPMFQMSISGTKG